MCGVIGMGSRALGVIRDRGDGSPSDLSYQRISCMLSWSRAVGCGAVVAVMAFAFGGCGRDHAVDPLVQSTIEGGQSTDGARVPSESSRRGGRAGTLTATFAVDTGVSQWVQSRTQSRYQARVIDGRLVLDASTLQRVSQALRPVGAPRAERRPAAFAALERLVRSSQVPVASGAGVAMASDAGDYSDTTTLELTLTPSEATSLPQYATYSEAIDGDPTQIAQIIMTRSSPSDPTAVTTLTINGVVLSTATVAYTYSGGLWNLSTIAGTAYGSGGSIANGALENLLDEEITRTEASQPAGFATLSLHRLQSATQMCVGLLGQALLPQEAFAQASCNYYMRSALFSLGGMALSAVFNNPVTFILNGLGVANSIHSFARCMESQPSPT